MILSLGRRAHEFSDFLPKLCPFPFRRCACTGWVFQETHDLGERFEGYRSVIGHGNRFRTNLIGAQRVCAMGKPNCMEN